MILACDANKDSPRNYEDYKKLVVVLDRTTYHACTDEDEEQPSLLWNNSKLSEEIYGGTVRLMIGL